MKFVSKENLSKLTDCQLSFSNSLTFPLPFQRFFIFPDFSLISLISRTVTKLSEEYSLKTIKAVVVILGKENIFAGVYVCGFFGAKEEEKTGHVFVRLKKILTE